NVWGPHTNRSDEFSLSQIWVVRGSGANLETVETGWQKYRDFYGDYRPRLFIYFTPDNYGSGGCYNLSCNAFVQVNNSVYIGGGPFPGDAFGFAAYQRQIRYITPGNVWGTYPSLTESRSDKDCYDIKTNSSSGGWERYFYFGGPGYNSNCE